jgi:hypothetical protein
MASHVMSATTELLLRVTRSKLFPPLRISLTHVVPSPRSFEHVKPSVMLFLIIVNNSKTRVGMLPGVSGVPFSSPHQTLNNFVLVASCCFHHDADIYSACSLQLKDNAGTAHLIGLIHCSRSF